MTGCQVNPMVVVWAARNLVAHPDGEAKAVFTNLVAEHSLLLVRAGYAGQLARAAEQLGWTTAASFLHLTEPAGRVGVGGDLVDVDPLVVVAAVRHCLSVDLDALFAAGARLLSRWADEVRDVDCPAPTLLAVDVRRRMHEVGKLVDPAVRDAWLTAATRLTTVPVRVPVAV